MKKRMFALFVLYLAVGWCSAQTTQTSTGQNSPNINGVAGPVNITNGKVTVKDSPAVQALNSAAKEFTTEQASYNTIRQQAQSTLDSNQKSLQDQIKQKGQALQDQLAKDKKYKPLIDEITALQKQLQDAQNSATNDFNTKAGPLSKTLATDNALINGLEPVVRKENGLPDNAIYDPATQGWTIPAEKK